VALLALVPVVAIAVSPPGPPYPAPVSGQTVYDTAGMLSAGEIAAAEAQIAAIRERTGAEIVVYTQVKPESDSPELAQADADALGTQWGVGRKGFDDGLVILFDLDRSLCHGQVQLDAGAGFAAAFLTNAERQAIYENDMLPLLRECHLGGALAVALERVDAAATPEHAAALAQARQVDAVLGLLVAPVILVLLVGFACWHWLRFGRDPVYLDDPSIHMPAPPADLTPAAAALVWDGRSSRHTLTTAMLDLASHGEIAFREATSGLIVHHRQVGIETSPTVAETPELGLVRRHALGRAELAILESVRRTDGVDGSGYLDPEHVPGLAKSTDTFDAALEAHVVDRGWFGKAPRSVMGRWFIGAAGEGALGVGLLVAGANLPSQGLVLVGGAFVVSAIATGAVGRVMPARTVAGAMIRAILAAYRRTLQKTMAQARSMRQVVAEAQLDWLETPDQAFVWGVALGLQEPVQHVLDRSLEDARAATGGATGGTSGGPWFPAWYGAAAGASGSDGHGGGGGLMSSSALPNVGGMLAVIGTIGAAPSSSGSGGGGGGFGGGGAGGGF
jgi:uncharacterized membrane protein YgcG